MLKIRLTKNEDKQLLNKIVRRANELGFRNVIQNEHDIRICHLNGNPLDLKKLLDSCESDFIHDIHGISLYINRFEGKLMQCFHPKCARGPENHD